MENQKATTPTPTTKGLGKEVGSSGTVIFKGIIVQEEYNTKLSSHLNAIKIYDQMRRSDATVRSTLQVCKLPILSSTWDIEPATDDDTDTEIAAFVKHELFDRNLNWHDFLREGLTMFEFGHSVAEKTYELTDYEGKPRIGIKKIGFRKQRSIQAWETRDGKPGVTQQLVGSSVDIPMVKLIIFVNDREGDNYQGTSLLRYAYKHWDIKDKLDIINAIALEKLAIGVPILKKPADADQADLVKARDAMRNFRGNEEAYQEIPVGWEVEMMDMKANSTKDVIPTIQYHDRQIQISVLAQFLSLGGSEASGSRAVSQDHSKLFLLSEEATAKNLQTTVQEQLIKQLVDLNFTSDMLKNGYPKLTFSKIGDENATELATNIKSLMEAGAMTYDPHLEDYLRKILRVPELPEELKSKLEEDLEAVIEAKKTLKEAKKEPDLSLKNEPTNPDPVKQKEEITASAIQKAREAREDLIAAIVG